MATSTTATRANHSRDEDDVRDNSKCLCADMCPNSQREQHLYTDNSYNPLMDALNLQISNRNYNRKVDRYPKKYTTSASNPTTPLTGKYSVK